MSEASECGAYMVAEGLREKIKGIISSKCRGQNWHQNTSIRKFVMKLRKQSSFLEHFIQEGILAKWIKINVLLSSCQT